MIHDSPSSDKENLVGVDGKTKSTQPPTSRKLNTDDQLDDIEVVDGMEDEYDDDSDASVELAEQDKIQDIDIDDDFDSRPDRGVTQNYGWNNSTGKIRTPPANDVKGLASRLTKPIPDYPVKEEKHYVWEINDWMGLKADKVRSPKFRCGGYDWNILLFPRGNNNTHLSVYMEPHPITEGEDRDGKVKQEDDWHVCAQFFLDIWNPNHPECHLPSGLSHRFSKNETDWGFSSLIDLKQLHSANPRLNQMHPILEGNKLNITGYVKVIDDSKTGVLWHSFIDYDSKKNTGYVGLNNQGATCYLNSLLQSYYTTKIFRDLVYQIPTDKDTSNKSVPLSLQRIFYMLKSSSEPVPTLELTKSFGWDSSDAFTQHDVQELNRILMDKLETAMKGTKIENRLNDIFVGKMRSFIKCVNVPYESSRVEDFWDIQLNVKGFRNLELAFENYIEIEMLEGENKYQAGDGYGYQDAKKGVVFESFPPVLHLQLKRFEYDFMVDDLVKIDDLYEYPDSIDLRPYLDEDLPESVKNENWNYKLHGVLVHQGSISNGHYYAMIKPFANDETWLRFDDDKVWKITPYNVFNENYGANELSSEEFSRLTRLEQQENMIRRVTSAYMLVYYRESGLDKILPDHDGSYDLVPSHIPRQIEEEIKERENLERMRQEALYFTNVEVVTNDNFRNFDGFDLYPDPTIPKLYDESLFDPASKPLSLKVRKEDTFLSLHKLIGVSLNYFDAGFDVAKHFDSLPFRLLPVNHRNNHTNRTDAPLSPDLFNLSVNVVYTKAFNRKYDEMVFFVEDKRRDLANIQSFGNDQVETPANFTFQGVQLRLSDAEDFHDIQFKEIYDQSSSIIIFFKYFDPVSQTVKGITHMSVKKDAQIGSLTKQLNSVLGFPEDTQLELFEELSHAKIEKIDFNVTFEKSEMSNGDIITIQVANPERYSGSGKFKNLVEYYRFLLTKLHIVVRPYKRDIEEAAEPNLPNDGNQKKGGTLQADYPLAKILDTWISTLSSFNELASTIAQELGGGIDPKYLRLFIVNSQGQRYALKSTHHLSQFFPKSVPVSQITTFEYEVLKMPLKDFENLRSIKVNWVTNLLNYQLYELLVPKMGTVLDLMGKLLAKIDVKPKDRKHILLWAGINHKFYDLIRFDRSIESLNDNLDLYAGIFPSEVEILVSHDMFKRLVDENASADEFENSVTKKEFINAQQLKEDLNLIPAFHFHKNRNYHHGVPFILPIYPGEKFLETKERLRMKLGVGTPALEKIRFALADDSDKGHYLEQDNDDLVLYTEINKSQVQLCFALDHPDKSARRPLNVDKGISIK